MSAVEVVAVGGKETQSGSGSAQQTPSASTVSRTSLPVIGQVDSTSAG
jgi:hypothetical protein